MTLKVARRKRRRGSLFREDNVDTVDRYTPDTDPTEEVVPRGRIEGFSPQLLREMIDSSGLSRAQIAVAVNVSPQVLGRWINGHTAPGAARAKLLADVLGVDVLDFSGKTIHIADIVDLRQRMGLSTEDAGEAAGMTKQQIYDIERATTVPSAEKLDALGRVYEQNPSRMRKAWVLRRINRFGRESLKHLSEEDRAFLHPWAD